MGKVLMGAAVSVDRFIADDQDGVGALFDWYHNGDVAVTLGDPDRVFHVSAASAEYLQDELGNIGADVIGRRLFDLAGRSADGPGDRVSHVRYAVSSAEPPHPPGSRPH